MTVFESLRKYFLRILRRTYTGHHREVLMLEQRM